MKILVTLVRLPNLPTKLADVELICDGSLDGFRLTGFQVWIARDDPSALNVTFPARTFAKGGGGTGMGYYAYLRPVVEGEMTVSDSLKAAILTAYEAEKKKPADEQRTAVFATRPAPPKKKKPAAPAVPAAGAPRLVDPRGVRPARAASAIPGLAESAAAAARAANDDDPPPMTAAELAGARLVPAVTTGDLLAGLPPELRAALAGGLITVPDIQRLVARRRRKKAPRRATRRAGARRPAKARRPARGRQKPATRRTKAAAKQARRSRR